MPTPSPITLMTLPPIDSDRISFTIDTCKNDPSVAVKQLRVDGKVVESLPFSQDIGQEPNDGEVYSACLARLRAQKPAEKALLKSLHSQQLELVQAWLLEKTNEYQQQQGEAASRPVLALSDHLVQAIGLAQYEPTGSQMIETLNQFAQSLEKRNAARAAKKIRVAGNFISSTDAKRN